MSEVRDSWDCVLALLRALMWSLERNATSAEFSLEVRRVDGLTLERKGSQDCILER